MFHVHSSWLYFKLFTLSLLALLIIIILVTVVIYLGSPLEPSFHFNRLPAYIPLHEYPTAWLYQGVISLKKYHLAKLTNSVRLI